MAVEAVGWRSRHVLITGAAGFVGRVLTARLRAFGAETTGLVRAHRDAGARNTVVGRLEDFPLLERTLAESPVDVVFHLGAQAIIDTARQEPLATLETNVAGTWNILEACRRSGQTPRVVIASTDRLYHASGTAEAASRSADALDVYSASKLCAEQIGQTYRASYGIPLAVARTANVFGPGDINFSRLIPGTIRAVLEGRRPVILSDGSPVRDYIYVKDVAEAYIELAQRLERPEDSGITLKVGSGEKTSVLDLTRLIIRLMDRPDLEPDVRGRPTGASPVQTPSEDQEAGIRKWRPSYGLEQGLKETIAWFRDNPNLIPAETRS